jgi:hypothetical protein
VGFVVDKVALGRFSPSTSVSPANIIPPLLHIHLSPPHEVCNCSDQAAHYHNLGPQVGASLLTRHIGWKHKKKVKKNIYIQRQILLLRIFSLIVCVGMTGKHIDFFLISSLLPSCHFTSSSLFVPGFSATL